MISSAAGGDVSWLRLALAFSLVLALLAGLGFILKYVSTRGLMLSPVAARKRRMKIVENLALDTRRRLVIVDCDGRQHLLLLGAERDIVVETNLPAPPVPSANP
ncbi:MAG: FliO/MopB family protein [Alphaproteobacteria bacterium]|nr:FliO/MopB family protein [Alphaproteobacteria bacterium]